MSYCCVRNYVTPGEHSLHCGSYTGIKSKPSKMVRAPEPEPLEDPGQGDGCEGGKCQIGEKR